MNHRIGELNEQPLHAALKEWYAHPGDRFEVEVDGYYIDLVRGEQLIEIQTGNFSSIKSKLKTLVKDHPICLVYPIAAEKWLYKLPREGWEGPRRRKSPKRGRVEELFWELVRFPELMSEENFYLEVALIQEEEVRRYGGDRYWYKNGWKTEQRKLLDVLERHLFETPADFLRLVTGDVPEQFTTGDLREILELPRGLAGKMAYCLREMGAIRQVGKRGRAYLYERV